MFDWAASLYLLFYCLVILSRIFCLAVDVLYISFQVNPSICHLLMLLNMFLL